MTSNSRPAHTFHGRAPGFFSSGDRTHFACKLITELGANFQQGATTSSGLAGAAIGLAFCTSQRMFITKHYLMLLKVHPSDSTITASLVL